ncbi:MAG: 3-isopropylmalate dehydratase large subunit [Firmicutes bacterium]|jgi:3-isopropylmalate/(R)-2-methylmalate dehydratase large subunit|nr:3-isopropylmalate dehydratase large subunit [Bacillota bacterium]
MKKPMTMTQKILAAHSNKEYIESGEFIEIKLDMVLGNDITTPVAIESFKKLDKEVFDTEKISIVPDHFTPNKDIQSAMQCKVVREFAKCHNIKNYFEIGQMGIEHVLLPEKGLVVPGDTIIGADSHTCTFGALGAFSTGIGSTDMGIGMAYGKMWVQVPEAIKVVITGKKQNQVSGKDVILHLIGILGVDGALYKSLEFTGEGIKELTIDDRFTISNMAIEAGAKNGIFPVDDITIDYVKEHSTRDFKEYSADSDAVYSRTVEIDLNTLEPTVAFPHLPENTRTFADIPEIKIDQVVIGSCTNGRISDLRAAAEIMKNRQVAEGVRTIVFPGTQKVYLDAIKEGLIEIFINAGAIVSTPTCGPCLGGHMGILAQGERAVCTTNRNFVGRMGHVESEVYLSSPAVAAASAISGTIMDPRKM